MEHGLARRTATVQRQEFKRSAFHAREWDAARLEKLQEPLDVVISYDWPRGADVMIS